MNKTFLQTITGNQNHVSCYMEKIFEQKSVQRKIRISPGRCPAALLSGLLERLDGLGVTCEIPEPSVPVKKTTVDLDSFPFNESTILPEVIEFVLQHVEFCFDELTPFMEGESKILKLLTDNIVVEAFKPTVYSYTVNRYGKVEGTDDLRIRFTAEIFRKMNRIEATKNLGLKNVFLAMVETPQGLFLLQERVELSNLEVRVKRYHIGSPLHRYKYTENYGSVQADGMPIKKWTRFDRPLVCFDWRHPQTDEQGNRLADEPISDDYASVWMHNIPDAKKLASTTFLWLEKLFAKRNLLLIDICFFIDRSGRKLFGEISPDCMRVKKGLDHPGLTESLDKDIWRQGEKEKILKQRYLEFYELLFSKH